jgi:acyl-coenzyme A synthetase/AMP-(fatty) acid ligase
VARGDEGLLHIAGRSLFRGYWGREDPQLFFEHDGRRFYNTGDVVRETADEGYIYVGRRDRMVKRRGFRIELAEIERGLYQSESVREAAAVAVPDPSSNVRILAYVVPQPGRRPSIIELKTHCGRTLPSYMSPDVFVILDGLPRTSTDKVDYQRLLAMSPTTKSHV